MKEDVLEQIVEDHLQLAGCFTMHNIRFRSRTDHPDYVKNHDGSSAQGATPSFARAMFDSESAVCSPSQR